MIRCIVMDNETGSNETVVFTEDMEKDAEDYTAPGQSVVTDEKLDVDFPSGFPLDYILKKQ